MPLMKRPGVVGRSIREYVTEPAAALAFFETKRRPVPVAAHSVPVSLAARSIATTLSLHGSRRRAAVRSVAPAADPLEVAAARVGGRRRELGAVGLQEGGIPPQSWVRQTLWEPWKIEPAVAGFGSAITGG